MSTKPESTKRVIDPNTFSPVMALFAYGGVHSSTVLCWVNDPVKRYNWERLWHPGDAAVDRQRSEIASNFFFHKPLRDVLLMIDHDVTWSYGDADYVVERAYECDGVVGGVYCKRAVGAGHAGRFNDGALHEVGSDELIPLGEDSYVGAGFLAISRAALQRIVDQDVPLVAGATGPFFPFFIPRVKKHTVAGHMEYLSEDWAFLSYCQEAEVPVFAAMRPVLTHNGEAPFTMMDAFIR